MMSAIRDNRVADDLSNIEAAATKGLRHALLLELIKAAPRFILGLTALIAILLLRAPITSLLDRSTEIGIGPVSLKTAEIKLSQFKIDKSSNAAAYFQAEQIETLTNRYSEVLTGGRRVGVLWVDDNPSNNKDLVDFLDVIGVTVVVARSYPEAIARLQERSFNAVVTDYSRKNDAVQQRALDAGEQFWGSGALLARRIAESGCGRRTIIFSSDSTDDKPTAPGVAVQTNSYYILLLAVADMLKLPTASCRL